MMFRLLLVAAKEKSFLKTSKKSWKKNNKKLLKREGSERYLNLSSALSSQKPIPLF